MNKIPSVFQRIFSAKGRVTGITEAPTPGCEWVLAGDGVATRKWDGTAVMVQAGKLHKRLDIKNLKEPPPGWVPCARLEDSNSKPGWYPVGDGPEDRWHREAWELCSDADDGTYELCGPKINGNPENFAKHTLVQHGLEVHHDAPRTLGGLREYLEPLDVEGLVFHHPDGRMAKIRKEDLGLKRVRRSSQDGQGDGT